MVELGNILKVFRYDADSPLIITGGWFLFIFIFFYAILILFKNRQRARVIYITLFSAYFYYKTSGLYLIILLLMSLSDYTIAGCIYNSFSERYRKRMLTLSIVIDIGVLCYFKYTNFLFDIIRPLLYEPFDIENIFVPAGISFFTFQSVAYVIDIYRCERIKANSYIDYLFFLSFFPHILAGPIMRGDKFLTQIEHPSKITKQVYNTAFFLIIIGLFKKAVISDYISFNFIDRVLDDPIMYTGFENMLGVYGYTLQIYCDFSGYTDLALGLSMFMGYQLPQNFNRPYLSATPTEFWRRWHITLSSWLRDYLYIPLGGNRKGKIRTYINLLITMLIGGLWHGAALKFLFWGLWHGAGLCIHKLLHEFIPSVKLFGSQMSKTGRLLGTLLTFHFICIGWIFFRANSFENGEQILVQIFTNFTPALIFQVLAGYLFPIMVIVMSYIYIFSPERIQDRICDLIKNSSYITKILILVAVCWLILQIQSGETQSFIYFQF